MKKKIWIPILSAILVAALAGLLAVALVVATVATALIGGGVALGVYLTDYAPAEGVVEEAMATATREGDYLVFDAESTRGFIFYPGGKVDAAAYAPLMQQIAKSGVTCVVAEMPFHLAVFGVNAWEGAKACAPEVTTWYIGGHSLGGAMASTVATRENGFSGLIMLAAYATAPIEVPVLSIYGELDGVMNREKYEQGRAYLPEDAQEVIIFGGNHAGFGYYGAQEGDGEATITQAEQINITARKILSFIPPDWICGM